MEPTIDPDTTPALVPPQEVIPNFINPPSIAPAVIAGLAVMCGVTTVAFTARLFTRIYVMKQVHLEDYLLAFGWAFAIVFFSFMFAQAPFSLGRNQYNVSLTQMELFLQYVNLTETFYIFGMFFTKLAILTQLKSIFRSNTRDWIYWLFIALMILVAASNLAIAIVLIAQCIPREKVWNPSVPGVCINPNASTIASGAFNVVLDILIFMLPIYAVFRLKLAIKRKLGISTVFAIGLLACVSSLLRLYYSILLVDATDLTYDMVDLCWTAALETTSAILVASFPVMPRLYRFLCGERPAAGYNITHPSYPRTAFSPTSRSRGGPGKNGSDALVGHQTNYSLADSVHGKGTPVNYVWLPLEDDSRRERERRMRENSLSDRLVRGPTEEQAW